MNKLTVRTSLMAVLTLFAAMILVGAGVGVYALSQANQSTSQVYQMSSQVIAINDAYKDTTRTRSAMTRAYSILKEGGAPADKDSALKSAQTSYDRTLKQLARFNDMPAYPGQDAALKSGLVTAGRELSQGLEQAANALRADDSATYSRINAKDLTPLGANFSSLLEKFQKEADTNTSELMESRGRDYQLVRGLVVLGLAIAMALVVAVHFMLKRVVLQPLDHAVGLLDQVARGDLTAHIQAGSSNEIGRLIGAIGRMQQDLRSTVSKVRSGADAINTGAEEISAGNMDLSSRTETQASSLEETAASMEELTSTVRQNAENAQQARQLVQNASDTAAKGGEVMGQMVNTMQDINDSSRRIVDIISVIDGIAFQTNILALNAAVEAARAGEQGRGFAVVASEVRNLAQRSATAAKEIKELIDNSVSKVDFGATLVQQAGATMNEVVDSVRHVTGIVAEIAEASREQSDGIEQVNRAITQMDEVTQQNAALVEQAAAATQSLQQQASNLAATVSVFKIEGAGAPSSSRQLALR
ncbi:methyl-accepting chemotaxis protein [Oxalobacteraceae bacterium A2-2]